MENRIKVFDYALRVGFFQDTRPNRLEGKEGKDSLMLDTTSLADSNSLTGTFIGYGNKIRTIRQFFDNIYSSSLVVLKQQLWKRR